jgi:Ca-activated chloride channel family protein
MHRLLVIIFFLLFHLYPDRGAQAESPGTLVERGNKAYSEEKYDDALSSYEKALEKAPDSPEVLFNKGAVYYKKGEFDKANDAFDRSAGKAEDKGLEASVRFNQGNTYFRKAERLMLSDLNGALENSKKSIQNYRQALELEPGFKEAAENMETGRLLMKSIMEKMENEKKRSQDKNQNQNQDKEQDPEKGAADKAQKDKDQPGEEGGEPEDREQSRENQSGRNKDENQANQGNSGQDQPERSGEEYGTENRPGMENADADSILDEEKENKNRRRARIQGGYRGVDRDW